MYYLRTQSRTAAQQFSIDIEKSMKETKYVCTDEVYTSCQGWIFVLYTEN